MNEYGDGLTWQRVHVRRVVRASDEDKPDRLVFCRAQGRHVSLDTCGECPRLFGMDRTARNTFLICRQPRAEPDEAPAHPSEPRPVPPPDKVPVSAVMTSNVICVEPDVGIESLLSVLLERAISGVPVGDETGKPVGIVSKTDLVRLLEDGAIPDSGHELHVRSEDGFEYELGPGFHAEELSGVTAADLMCPLVYSVHPDSSLAQAAAMMAFEGVHRVPVVSDAGEVVGLLSAIDVLRWLGRESGYVIPDNTAAQLDGEA